MLPIRELNTFEKSFRWLNNFSRDWHEVTGLNLRKDVILFQVQLPDRPLEECI